MGLHNFTAPPTRQLLQRLRVHGCCNELLSPLLPLLVLFLLLRRR